jgi:CBS domain-containing protein
LKAKNWPDGQAAKAGEKACLRFKTAHSIQMRTTMITHDARVREPAHGAAVSTVPGVPHTTKASDVSATTKAAKPVVVVVTDRALALDVLAKSLGEKGLRITAGDKLPQGMVTCRDDADLDKALMVMAAHQVQRLPIVNARNELVGVITQTNAFI